MTDQQVNNYITGLVNLLASDIDDYITHIVHDEFVSESDALVIVKQAVNTIGDRGRDFKHVDANF